MMQGILEREATRRGEEAARLANRPKVELADYRKIGLLGMGTFGRVWLVEQRCVSHTPTSYQTGWLADWLTGWLADWMAS